MSGDSATKVNLSRLKLFAIAAVVLAASAVVSAQQFPRLNEKNLAGQPVVLPDAAAGKVAVLILGFSRDSSAATEAWAKRILTDFGREPQFVLYQLAVIEDAPSLVRGMILSGMRRSAPEAQHATFVAVTHDEAALKKLTNYSESKAAYVVVLDRTGKVVDQVSGVAVEPAYGELHSRLQMLLK